LKLYPISAVSGEGLDKLKYAMAEQVDLARKASAAASVNVEQDHFSGRGL
jgi:hypothetical protein